MAIIEMDKRRRDLLAYTLAQYIQKGTIPAKSKECWRIILDVWSLAKKRQYRLLDRADEVADRGLTVQRNILNILDVPHVSDGNLKLRRMRMSCAIVMSLEGYLHKFDYCKQGGDHGHPHHGPEGAQRGRHVRPHLLQGELPP